MKALLVSFALSFSVVGASAGELAKSIQENKSMIVSKCYLQQKEVFSERSRIFHEMMKDCVKTKFKQRKNRGLASNDSAKSASVDVLKVDKKADLF